MENNETQPKTFVEMFLELLEDRFPWLGKNEPASGADTVDRLNDLHEVLRKARTVGQRKKSTRR
ncbi:MAG: hypothetical protein BGO25_08480 [Acidobacteriales bacterium 59-55]|nr:MAG: hypothetical protein BGO25_08480 [Acidobacteriales bacterium 59-55]